MRTFQAWLLDARRLDLLIDDSPVGPIVVQTWGDRDDRVMREDVQLVPDHGSAVVLPTRDCRVLWDGHGLAAEHFEARLGPGCYAVAPAWARIYGGAGLLIYTSNYVGLPQVGGPVEARGRLRYIDGCSDTLLVCPPQRGEPCLNLLHLPAGIDQTAHTHPSDRIGIILHGEGECHTEGTVTPLLPGMFWYIPAGCVHSFHTTHSALDVLAWHPDSDFGPSHDEHPMVNRTIVDGLPANDPKHAAIRTQ